MRMRKALTHYCLLFCLVNATIVNAEPSIMKTINTSTDDSISKNDAYARLNVQTPNAQNIIRRISNRFFGDQLEKRLKRLAWRLHGRLLPLLHLTDEDFTPELFVNMRVLWNKAISAVDPKSPVYEKSQFWTYRMLPKSTRWVLRAIPARFFPRWMHANIELRTAYLNQAIAVELERSRSAGYANIRMIVLGGGYDARPVKLLAERQIDQAWEFDLPTVAKYKGKLIEKKSMLPKEDISKIDCIGIDLNDPEKLRSSLTTMIGNDVNAWHTIIISEALFLYLQPGVPEQLLDVCRDIFSEASLSFCFADKLANIAPDDRKAGEEWFAKIGWTLIDWIPKEGATRHMGVARPFR